MRRILFTLLFVILLSLFSVSDSYACKCINPESISVNEALDKSSAVFVGEVVSIEKQPKYFNVKFDVLASYKGVDRKAYIIVKTPLNDESCGYSFTVGERYLVFAYGEDAFYTGLCTPTTVLMNAGDIMAELPNPIFSYLSSKSDSADKAAEIDSLLKDIEKGITKYKDAKLLIKVKDARLLFKDYSSRKEVKAKTACPPCPSCPPCPPCPTCYSNKPLRPNTMSDIEFHKFYESFKSAVTDKDKLRLVDSIMGSDLNLYVNQIIILLKEIGFSSNKKKFLSKVKGHIADRHNIYQIYNHLDFQSEKDEAQKILEGK